MADTGRTGGRPVARWRTALGVVLAVLAGLAATLTPVAGWGRTLLTDTDTFVVSYAPVVHSEPVKQALSSRLSNAIIDQLGVDNVLIRRLVTNVVDSAVQSEEFAAASTAALRLAHQELVAQLSGEPGRLAISADGVVELPLAPFGDALKQRLTDAGVPFADRLPELSGGITLFTVDPRLLPSLQTAFRVLDLTAPLLPWLALALALAAVRVGPGVRRPLIRLGLSLLGSALLIGLAWYLAMHWLLQHLGDDLGPVAGLVSDATTSAVTVPLLVLGIVGGLFAALALLTPRSVPADDGNPAGSTG